MPQCPQYIYYLPTSLLVPYWFVAYKLYNAVIPKDEIFHVDVYSNITDQQMIITTPCPYPKNQKQAKTMTTTTNSKAHINKQANNSKKHKSNKNEKKEKEKLDKR